MLRVTSYQGNANKSHNGISPHPSENGYNPQIKKINAGEVVGEKGTLKHCWWDYKLVQPLRRTVQRLLRYLKIYLPSDLTIILVGIYKNEMKLAYERVMFTSMFIAAQFTIAKTWNQPRCPSADGWIRKMWWCRRCGVVVLTTACSTNIPCGHHFED